MSPRFWNGWATSLLALLVLAITPGAVLAHERREVGKYLFVVGFSTEPALQAEPNGAQVTVTVPSENARPIEGLADSLKVSVAFGGGQPREFRLRSVFGTPGRYVSDFIPTRAGSYVFTFSGSIEGTQVSERFESGPGRFNDVEPADAIQFPEAIPPANEAVRIARAASDDAAEAQAMVAQARTIAIGGVGVGALGLMLGLGALFMVASRH